MHDLVPLAIGFVGAAVFIGVWWRVLRKPVLAPEPIDPSRVKAPPPEQPKFMRVGGVTVDTRDFSPELLEKIRATYFRPDIKGKYVQVIDLTATCPRSHATRDRVVLISRDLSTAKELSAGLARSKADIRCDECGKPGRVSARSVVWEGPAADWDGAV